MDQDHLESLCGVIRDTSGQGFLETRVAASDGQTMETIQNGWLQTNRAQLP
jgi:hypothetical protein